MVTHFILNEKDIKTDQAAGMLVLDYLRRTVRYTGTKEGCKEGDCGACMVLVGEIVDGKLHYKPVTSCLLPMGEMHGKHLVTIEGLNLDFLNPVQKAIVDEGGSQCGFCTPGIVVSLIGYLLQDNKTLNLAGVKYALGGNLCRCTGYSSLKRAAVLIKKQIASDISKKENKPVVDKLIHKRVIPAYFNSIPDRLKKIKAVKQAPPAKWDYLIAGGTDIYIQKGDELAYSRSHLLNNHPEMKKIKRINGELHIGALTTFEEFAEQQEVVNMIPQIKKYNLYNASWAIRNRATLGGNIINASPIADMTILLLALKCRLVLKDQKERQISLKSFFKGYKKLAKTHQEILTKIIIPIPGADSVINFEKVSKRKTLDIASVNSAIYAKVIDNTINEVELSMGGVSEIPLFMKRTCTFLTGKNITQQTIEDACVIALTEISPISDIRGSKEYKTLLVNQFMLLHFNSFHPKQLIESADYAT